MLILLKLVVIKIKTSNLILRRLGLFAAPSLISVSRPWPRTSQNQAKKYPA